MVRDSYRIEIEMDQSMSNDSKKTSDEYYELQLQLRFQYFDDVDSMKVKCFDLITNKFDSINKFEEVSNGFNFYFRNHSEMGKITSLFVRNYLINEKRSNKLVGRDNLISKNKYRYFLSLTLVNLKKGDRINLKGVDYTIKAINKNDLVLIEDATFNKKVVTYSIVCDYISLIKD